MSHLSGGNGNSASWEYLGLGTSKSQFTPAAQKSEEQGRWSHCHSSGDTCISVHILPVPCAAPALSGDNVPAATPGAVPAQLSAVSLPAGDAAHRAARARVLRFALGHALRTLPEPAASSRDGRSQPVPSCRTRPACPAAGSLPSCWLPAQPPAPCSTSGRGWGSKSGISVLAFGRLCSPAPRCPVCVRFAL